MRTDQQFNPIGFPMSGVSMHPAVPPRAPHLQGTKFNPPKQQQLEPEPPEKPPPSKRDRKQTGTRQLVREDGKENVPSRVSAARPTSAPARRSTAVTKGSGTSRPTAAQAGVRGYASKALANETTRSRSANVTIRDWGQSNKNGRVLESEPTGHDDDDDADADADVDESKVELLAGDGLKRAGCMGILQERLVMTDKLEQFAIQREAIAEAPKQSLTLTLTLTLHMLIRRLKSTVKIRNREEMRASARQTPQQDHCG